MTKVVILAGGRGSRLGKLGNKIPKALVPIGGRPLIEHVIAMFARSGFRDVIIATGFLSEKIEAHFSNGILEIERVKCTVKCIYTGLETNTAGRVRRLSNHITGRHFILANGDGISDLNATRLLDFHKSSRTLGTITVAPSPVKRFGLVEVEGCHVRTFLEKPALQDHWISAGIYVLDTDVIDLISGDTSSLEVNVFPALAKQAQLSAYRHEGFWRCMDMPFEAAALDGIVKSGYVPGIAI